MPIVPSAGHIHRVMREKAERPGLICYTLVNCDMRRTLENRAHGMCLPLVSALDPVLDALSQLLGQEAQNRPGGQHKMDAAYFERVEAIHYTIAHDDGALWEEWEEADIVDRKSTRLNSSH